MSKESLSQKIDHEHKRAITNIFVDYFVIPKVKANKLVVCLTVGLVGCVLIILSQHSSINELAKNQKPIPYAVLTDKVTGESAIRKMGDFKPESLSIQYYIKKFVEDFHTRNYKTIETRFTEAGKTIAGASKARAKFDEYRLSQNPVFYVQQNPDKTTKVEITIINIKQNNLAIVNFKTEERDANGTPLTRDWVGQIDYVTKSPQTLDELKVFPNPIGLFVTDFEFNQVK